MLTLQSISKKVLRHYGSIRNEHDAQQKLYPDIPEKDWEILRGVFPYTQSSPERLFGLIEIARYVQKMKIPGAYVECGVWKGGSSMAALFAWNQMNQMDREIYLFDTYEGMPQPTEEDIGITYIHAQELYDAQKNEDGCQWNACSLDEVKNNLAQTKYPAEKIHFIKGMVEETLPKNNPPSIAILRLDTDFYQSTKHELEHLYPLLSSGGFLILDDYGHWQGARKAVDDYFSSIENAPFLFRVDYACRVAIKP